MSITDMNALPDISGNDSQRLQEFVRVTAREVKVVGGASAGTTLEMIGYIRELEHALVNTRRAAVTGPRTDLELLPFEIAERLPEIGGKFGELAAMCKSHVAAFIQKVIATAATSSPTPAAPSVADAIQEVRDMQRDWEREARNSAWWQRYVDAATYIISRLESLAPPESTRVAGEQLGHVDFVFDNMPCCKVCGLVRPAEGWTRPCKGPHIISLHESADTARRAADEIDALLVPLRDYDKSPGIDALAAIISKYFAADKQWRQGMRDAAKEVCDACDNEERYGPARKIVGSTRWWHGDDNIPCEAGGIWFVLAERAVNAESED